MNENYTVGDVARMSGVTVRTLHHYDAIGLLKPSGRTLAGYREYSSADVVRLQQIVAYRACGLPLDDIAAVLSMSGLDRAEHLSRQIAMLDARLADLSRQRQALGKELQADQMGITLDPQEYFDEVLERWGDTDAYAESSRRTAGYTTEDWLRARTEQEAVNGELAACLAAGVAADDERAMAAAEAHRQHICRWYYDCTYDIHVGLADMYVADPRFTAHYENVSPGLAHYVQAAIYANALRQ